MSDHEGEPCPGLGKCSDSWHVDGCEPYWQYADASGYVIKYGMYDEDDAMIKTLWTSPDGPDEVWYREAPGSEWMKE